MQISARWFRVFGLALLIFLFWTTDFSSILKTLSSASLFPVILAVLLNIPQIGIKAMRWKLLMKSQNIVYPLRETFLSYFGSIYIGLLTPGRLGEFVKALHVSRDLGIPAATAFSSVLLDRIFDFYLLLFLGLAALSGAAIDISAGIVIALVLMILPLLFLFSDTFFQMFQKPFSKSRGFPGRIFSEGGWIKTTRDAIKSVPATAMAISTLLTILAYGVFLLQCYLLAESIGMSIPLVFISFAVALGSLVTLLPISISGLGTREAAMMAYLGTVGVMKEKSLAFSLLLFVTFYIGGAVLGAVAWFIKPAALNSVKESSS